MPSRRREVHAQERLDLQREVLALKPRRRATSAILSVPAPLTTAP
jgi:hypothetical protein